MSPVAEYHFRRVSGYEYGGCGCIPLMNHNLIPVLMSPSLHLLSEIFIHGDLQWDIFQVIISRSTTPDLIKIGMKLQEFFTQQFDTSKRALSTWGPGSYLPPKAPLINIEKGATELCECRRLPDSRLQFVHMCVYNDWCFTPTALRSGCRPSPPLARGPEGDRRLPHIPLPDAPP